MAQAEYMLPSFKVATAHVTKGTVCEKSEISGKGRKSSAVRDTTVEMTKSFATKKTKQQ